LYGLVELYGYYLVTVNKITVNWYGTLVKFNVIIIIVLTLILSYN